MFPLPRPAALLRRAMTLLPLSAALASAHPGGHGRPGPLPPRACLEAAPLDFGKVAVGAKSESSLTVRNRCPQAFSIWKVSAGSRAFSSSLPGPVRIPGRGTGAIPVAFAPSDTGAKSAVLVLSARYPEQRVYARVTGIGTAPPPPPPAAGITVSPSSVRLAMGPAETDTFRLAVTNHGTSPRAEILVDAVGDPEPRPERGWRILYLNTYVDGPWVDELTTLLTAQPGIDTVAPWYGGDSLPTLARMLEYDAVMVVSVHPWKDSVAAGNLLADYLEAGGKVLLTASCLAGGPLRDPGLSGRIMDYAPIGKTDWTYSRPVANLVPHPITEGVQTFQSAAILQVTNTRGQGAGIPLGTFQDGYLIGAYHPDKPLVFLNISYGSFSGDIPRLLTNTFDYLGGMMAWMTPKPPFDPVIFVVPDGETKELKVAVNTFRLRAGTHTGAVRLRNVSDTGAVPMDVPVSLAVSSQARLSIDPESVDFGPAWQGGKSSRTVRLVNPGSAATHVTGFAGNGKAFSLTAGLPLEIPAFSFAYAQAVFAPTALGADSARIETQSDAQETQTPGITLRGTGIVPPILSVSPQGFDVRMAEGSRSNQVLNIRNPGGDSLKLVLRAVVDSAGGHPATGPEKPNILYINTLRHTYDNPSDFFMWNLKTDPRIGELTSYDGIDSTPTLEYMRRFDAILVSAGEPWADPVALGNRLADYVDGGGKLCIMHAALYASNVGLGGRIITPDYSPVAPAGGYGGQYLTDPADHPIMEGIGSDLSSDWIMDVSETQGGGIPLGRYNLGRLVGAVHPRKPVVFLNVFPLTGYFSVWPTVRLIGNAFQFLSEYYNWMQPATRTLALGPGENVDVPILFGAPFSPAAGNYSGGLNVFHNDPAQGNPLVVPARLTVDPAGTAAIP